LSSFGGGRETTRSGAKEHRWPARPCDPRDLLGEVLEESAFHAARGVRPPALRVAGEKVTTVIPRLLAATREELLTFDDPSDCICQGVPERMLVNAARFIHHAIAQVPTVHQITSPKGLASDAELGTIPCSGGAQARITEEIPFRMAVFDRTMAMLALDMKVFFHGVLIVRDPAVVAALVRVHRMWWDAGRDPVTRRPQEPPAHLVPVLACLHDGLPDHAAAARLGLSPRTYARRVSELLTLLGATSRFQAAVAAARRGWL